MAATALQDQWIERVLRITPQGAAPPASLADAPGARPEAESDADAARADYDALLDSVSASAALLRREAPDQAAAAFAELERATALADSGDLAGAARRLDTLAGQIGELRGQARQQAAQASIPAGLVAERVARLERARGRWSAALADARAASSGVLEHLREQSSPHAEALESVVQSYWDELDELLDAALADDGGDAQAGLRQGATAMQAELEGDAVMAELDALGYPVREAFAGALAEIGALVAPSGGDASGGDASGGDASGGTP